MTTVVTEQLTTRERHMLVHLRRAEELEVSLEYYASAFNVEAHELNTARQQLVRKGVIAAGPAKAGEAKKSPGFAPVRLVSSPPANSAASPAPYWRLHHPSGWSIECSSAPEVNWLRALVSGVAA